MGAVSKCVQRELTGKISPDLSEKRMDEMRTNAFPSKYSQIKQYFGGIINKLLKNNEG